MAYGTFTLPGAATAPPAAVQDESMDDLLSSLPVPPTTLPSPSACVLSARVHHLCTAGSDLQAACSAIASCSEDQVACALCSLGAKQL